MMPDIGQGCRRHSIGHHEDERLRLMWQPTTIVDRGPDNMPPEFAPITRKRRLPRRRGIRELAPRSRS